MQNGNPLLKSSLTLLCAAMIASSCLRSEAEFETVTLKLDTPSSGWNAHPTGAWDTDNAIYCLFQLKPPNGMSAQVITTIVSDMQLPRSPKPKKVVVIGKTWKWSSNEAIEYSDSLQSFMSKLPKNASRIEIPQPKN